MKEAATRKAQFTERQIIAVMKTVESNIPSKMPAVKLEFQRPVAATKSKKLRGEAVISVLQQATERYARYVFCKLLQRLCRPDRAWDLNSRNGFPLSYENSA